MIRCTFELVMSIALEPVEFLHLDDSMYIRSVTLYGRSSCGCWEHSGVLAGSPRDLFFDWQSRWCRQVTNPGYRSPKSSEFFDFSPCQTDPWDVDHLNQVVLLVKIEGHTKLTIDFPSSRYPLKRESVHLHRRHETFILLRKVNSHRSSLDSCPRCRNCLPSNTDRHASSKEHCNSSFVWLDMGLRTHDSLHPLKHDAFDGRAKMKWPPRRICSSTRAQPTWDEIVLWWLRSLWTPAGSISQCWYPVTSRTMGTVGLLSIFSILHFAQCCICVAVIWNLDWTRIQVLQSLLSSNQAALNVGWRELTSRLLSDLLLSSSYCFSRDLAPLPCWVFLERHVMSTQDFSIS